MLISELFRNDISKTDDITNPTAAAKPDVKLPFKVGDYDVYVSNEFGGEYNISVWDKNAIVAYLDLELDSDGFYEILVAGARVQGKRIVETLYKQLIRHGITLVTGESHSLGARKVWFRLYDDPEISVWGMHKQTHKVFPVTKSDSGELTGVDRTIYTDTKYFDPFDFNVLVMTKKHGDVDNMFETASKNKTKINKIKQQDLVK